MWSGKFVTLAALVAIFVSLLPSCTPTAQPAPGPAVEEPSIDQPEDTPLPTSTYTHTPSPTETFTPTFTPTVTSTFTPTSTLTFTPTATSTNTPLLPLPDFDDILSFGSGGAEDGFCQDWGDSTVCYFFDTPGSDSANQSKIWVTNPTENERITLASTSSFLEVSGNNFPANSPVSVLLYVDTLDPSEVTPTSNLPNARYQLANAKVVIADSRGVVNANITAQWKNGQKYLLLASTNRDGKIQLRSSSSEDRQQETDSWIVFWIQVGVSSCPGAPPQRMEINGRGYVCTKGENVRLRDAPARSANTILYLPVGSQFTVYGGPSCSDNWFWWNIRLDNGTTGWIAEGGDETDPYFICPIQ